MRISDWSSDVCSSDLQRTRIQKQLCQTDPTGVLGCLNTRRDSAPFNGNATFTAALTSKEFLATQGIPAASALGSLYGPDVYAGTTISDDPREVKTAFTPNYFTSELTLRSQERREGKECDSPCRYR